jgi:hypothetical protein
MNVQRISEYILRWSITLGGMLLALFLAKSVADGRTGLVTLALVGMAVVGITLALKERIGLVLPVVFGLTGTIPAMELPFAAKDIATMVIFTAFLAFHAFKVIPQRPTYRLVDACGGIMILYLATCWIRNPVGVEALQSDRVGGRPYFDVFIAVLAFFVISRTKVTARNSQKYAVLIGAGRMFDGFGALALARLPELAVLTAYYSSTQFSLVEELPFNNINQMVNPYSTERLGYLGFIGAPLLLLLAARYPISALLNIARPWRLALLITGIVFVLLSGFRSVILAAAGAFFLAGYLRRGWMEPLRIGVFCVLVYVFLAVGNGALFNLPLSAQRALSWLPGKWDSVAKAEAEGSTEWRTYMWKIMLTTNTYIDSHMFGDGFGFKRRDYERMAHMREYGGEGNQELFMISGGVHSGPVSAIRFVGYVGLALYLVILILIAMDAWRIAKRARGTPHETLAWFICLPAIIEPLYFTLVFGSFESSVTASIVLLGILHMLRNSLDAYERQSKAADPTPEILSPRDQPLRLPQPA